MAQIFGTAGDDTLLGTAAADVIDGLGGNDTLNGGGGGDTLRGGSGDDVVFSGLGNDVLDGGEGYDYLYFTNATAGVSIDVRAGRATGGAGSDTFSGFELLFGSAFADVFVGDDNGVGFLAGDGNDTLTGGAGRDHLEGNGGDDVIDGLGGVDIVAYYSAAGPVTVNLTLGSASGGLGNDVLRNIEDATGSVFDDTLTGSPADNLLEGSDGNDTFFSTSGADVLDGGNGIDRAIYALTRSAYTLQRTGNGEFTLAKPGTAADTLRSVERLTFADTKVALDLDGQAGLTARLIGAVFGPAAVANKQFVGIGLAQLATGTAPEALAAMAVAAAGATTHVSIVNLVWTNLFGSAPTAAQAAPYVALLDGGQYSVGALTLLAANQDFTAARIDLVGLMQTGIEYGP